MLPQMPPPSGRPAFCSPLPRAAATAAVSNRAGVLLGGGRPRWPRPKVVGSPGGGHLWRRSRLRASAAEAAGEGSGSPPPRVSFPSAPSTDATRGVWRGECEGSAPPPPRHTPPPPLIRRRRARQFLRVGVSSCGTALELQTAVTLYRRRDGVDQGGGGGGGTGGADPAAAAAATAAAAAAAAAATTTPSEESVEGPPSAADGPLSLKAEPHPWLPPRLALVSLLHVADAQYYAALDAFLGSAHGGGGDGGRSRRGADRAADGSPFAAVFTELVTEPSCLSWDPTRRGYTVSVPLVPTSSCRRLAASVGLVAQLDALPPHAHEGWLVADVRADALRQQVREAPGGTSPAATKPGVDAAAGRAAAARRSRAAAARLGATLLRAALWLVPLPELALLLTDWAAPTATGPRSTAGPGAGETPAARAATGASTVTGRSAAGGSVGISPLLPVVVLAAARGDLPGARRALFAQTLLAGAAVAAASQPSLTIGARNSAAMAAMLRGCSAPGFGESGGGGGADRRGGTAPPDGLAGLPARGGGDTTAASTDDAAGDGGGSVVALMYGVNHGASLARRLEDGFGMDAVGVAWLPAWTLAQGAVAVRWWAAWSALLSDAAGAAGAPAEWRTPPGTHGTAGDAARAAGWADVAAALDTAAPPAEEAATGGGGGGGATGGAAATAPAVLGKAVTAWWPGRWDGRLWEVATLAGLAAAVVLATALSAADYAATVEGVAWLLATAVERATLTTGGAGAGDVWAALWSAVEGGGGAGGVGGGGSSVAAAAAAVATAAAEGGGGVGGGAVGGGVLGERVIGELGGYALRHVLALRLLRAVVLEPLVEQVADV